MTAQEVIRAVIAHLRADPELMQALGSAERIRRSRDMAQVDTPLLTYSLIDDGYSENTTRVLTQWDIWARGLSQAFVLEARLKALLHSDLPVVVGGVGMWMLYQGGRDHADPEPDIVHRSFDFLFQPIRER